MKLLAPAFCVLATSLQAGVCDYRPSALIGGGATAAVVTAGAGTAAAGAGMQAAGFYTLTHAVTGATMLGSTAGGASAAGTVGIMGGTAGAVGTVASIIMAPVVIIGAAVAAGGVAAYEGGCYFLVERTDEYEEVLGILAAMSQRADPDFFKLVDVNLPGQNASLRILMADGEPGNYQQYRVDNLYIENGILKHSDWLINTTIGQVGYVEAASSKMPELPVE